MESRLDGFLSRRMSTWYLFDGETQNVPLPLDLVVRECSLGERWRIDEPQPEAGVFRFEQ